VFATERTERPRLTVIWFHGSPQTGAILEPIAAAAASREIRIVSYARPSYGGSTAAPGREVASAASDVGAIADALGIERFAVMGASGGGPHALACAALLPDRVAAVATFASLAPFRDEPGWFDGMAAPGGLKAAARGREARARFAETDDFDPTQFIAPDWSALEGPWRSLGQDAGAAGAAGMDGLIDDDVAFAKPWGFELAAVHAPVLLVQGGGDRVVPASHAQALLAALPNAELWLRPRDGHVSVLTGIGLAMDWLLERESELDWLASEPSLS
jgi:pimeloyl-ACP methyl ester carboxylesterase